MSYYNCRFLPPNEHVKRTEREWSPRLAVPPYQALQHTYIRSPQFLPNYSRNINPYFPKNEFIPYIGNVLPEEKSIIKGPYFSYDRNFQHESAPNHLRNCNRNEMRMDPLPSYNLHQRFNCEYSRPHSGEFHSRSILNPSTPQRYYVNIGNIKEFDAQQLEMKHLPNFNGLNRVAKYKSIRIPSHPPYEENMPNYRSELQDSKPLEYFYDDSNYKLLPGAETTRLTCQQEYTNSTDSDLSNAHTYTQTNNNFPIVSEDIKKIDSLCSNTQSCDNSNEFEELQNALESTDENSIAVYFLKNLYPDSRRESIIPELPSINQNTERGNCNFSPVKKNVVNCLDVPGDSTNQISANISSKVNLDELTEISNNSGLLKCLEITTETENSQDEKHSNKIKPSRENVEPSNSTLEYSNEDNFKQNKKTDENVEHLNNKPNNKNEGKMFIFQSPIINIIHQNEISTENLSTCSNGSPKLLNGGVKFDGIGESKLHSYFTNSITNFLSSHLEKFAEKKDNEQNLKSLSNEKLIFTCAANDTNICMDLMSPIAKDAQISTVVSLPEKESGEQDSNPSKQNETQTSSERDNNIQLKPKDEVSNEKISSIDTCKLHRNFAHVISSGQNNGCIRMNSADSVSYVEKREEPDFIYSNALNSSHIETSLSSVTNYVVDEPTNLAINSLEDSLEIDELQPVSRSHILQKNFECSRKKWEAHKKNSYFHMRFDDVYFPPDDFSASVMLLDNIFEPDEKYSLARKCNLRYSKRGKKKNKSKIKKSMKINSVTSSEERFYFENGNYKVKENKIVKLDDSKLHRDAITQTLKLDHGTPMYRPACKQDAQTQWESSDMNLHVTTDRKFECKISKSRCSLNSDKQPHNKINFLSDNQDLGSESKNKTWNLRKRKLSDNSRNVPNSSTTDTRKVFNHTTKDGKHGINNSVICKKKMTNNSVTGKRTETNISTAAQKKKNNYSPSYTRKVVHKSTDVKRANENLVKGLSIIIQPVNNNLGNKTEMKANNAIPLKNTSKLTRKNHKLSFISTPIYNLRKFSKNKY